MPNYLEMLSEAANRGADPVGMAKLDATPAPVASVAPVPASVSKEETVAAKAEQKMMNLGGRQVAMPTKEGFYAAAASQASGRGMDSAGEVEHDVNTMQPYQLRQKYGDQMGMELLLKKVAGDNVYQSDMSGTRSLDQLGIDSASGAATAAVLTIGGIAAFGTGFVNEKAGTAISAKLAELDQLKEDAQSPDLQRRRLAMRARKSLSLRDNEAYYQKDKETDGEMVATLRRQGRDFLDTLEVSGNDPATFIDGSVSAVGSIAALGPVGRTISAIAGALTSRAAKAAIQTAAAIDTATKTASVARTIVGSKIPASIGLMEAGGTYAGTANEIMQMPFDKLAKDSPVFNELVESGLSQEEARTRIANQAGRKAGVIQGLIAAPTGVLVSKFEGAPFKVPTVGTAFGNIGREVGEEIVQGISGQAAKNAAKKEYADRTQEYTEGTGASAGESATYAFGMTAGLQAPGVAAHTAKAGTKLAVDATVTGAKKAANVVGAVIKPGLDWAAERGKKVMAKNTTDAPMSSENIAKATSETVVDSAQNASVLKEGVAAAKNLTPEDRDTANRAADKLVAIFDLPDAEVDAIPVDEEIKALIRGSTDRNDALNRLADEVNMFTETDDTGAIPPGIVMYEMLEQMKGLMDENRAGLEGIPRNHFAQKIIKDHANLLNRIDQDPKIQTALRNVTTLIERVMGEQNRVVTDANVDTPEGIENIKMGIVASELAPGKLNIELAQQILNQADKGKITLTDSQRASLNGAKVLSNAAINYDKEAKALGLESKQDIVTREIKSNNEDGEKGPSAATHLKTILTALRAGDLEEAKTGLYEFGEFAQHMQNKVEALNTHFKKPNENKEGVRYNAINYDTREWYATTEGLKVSRNNANSIGFAQTVDLEAKTVNEIFEGLRAAFPQLNVDPVESVSLVPELIGDREAIASKFKAASEAGVAGKRSPAPKPMVSSSNPVPVSKAAPQTAIKPEPIIAKVDTAFAKAIQGSLFADSDMPAPVTLVSKKETKTKVEPELKIKTQKVEPIVETNQVFEKPGVFKLNAGQEAAFNKTMAFLKGEESTFSIIGSAGTGKTTIVNAILKALSSSDLKFEEIILSAPTHRANAVTRSKNPDSNIQTLHKLLGLKPAVDLENFDAKKIEFSNESDSGIPANSLIIMDESSMINDALFSFLTQQLMGTSSKVLFLGDQAQLSPVKQTTPSKALTSTSDTAELTQVMRAKNPQMLDESIAVRTRGVFTNQIDVVNGGGVSFTNNKDSLVGQAVKLFKSAAFKENPLLVRVLAYTNSQVTNYNNQIRNSLFGADAAPYIKGDLLMGYTSYGKISKETGMPIISNGVDYIVKSVSAIRTEEVFGVPIDVFSLSVADVYNLGGEQAFTIVSPKNSKENKDLLAKAAEAAISRAQKDRTEWKTYFSHKERFVFPFDVSYEKNGKSVNAISKNIEYGYAHTIHKSQGGTYTYVLVDDSDIGKARTDDDQKRLRYVGLTRAEIGAVILTNNTIAAQKQNADIPEPMKMSNNQIKELSDEKLNNLIGTIDRKVNDQLFTRLDAEITKREDAAVTKDVAPVVEPIVKAEPEVARTGTDAAFPDLIPNSRFKEAYKLPKEARTRIFGEESPFDFVESIMRESNQFARVTTASAHSYTEKVARAYLDKMDTAHKLADDLRTTLAAYLNKKRGANSLMDRYRDGTDIQSYPNGKVVNITEEVNGKLKFNDNLLESATLAAMQWHTGSNQYGRTLEPEKMAKLVGNGLHISEIDSAFVTHMNDGMSADEAVLSLGDKILSYWGVSTERDEAIGNTKGIVYALAGDLLEAMEKEGLIKRTVMTITSDGRVITELQKKEPGNKEHKDFIRVIPQIDSKDAASAFPSVIDRIVLTTPESVNYIGEPVPRVADFQMHSKQVENTPEQKQFIDNEQKTVFRANYQVINLYTALGRDAILDIFAGGASINEENYNVNHFKTIDGKNRTVVAAYDHLMGMVSEIENVAVSTAVSYGDVPIHYAYNMSSMGRLQMLGKYHPQGDKLVREAITPTRATLNLNDKKQSDMYILSLAQALGVKVHKKSLADANAEVISKLNNELAESMKLLSDWQADQSSQLPEGAAETIKRELKSIGALTTVGLHAMTDYARMLSEDTDRSKFTTEMYIEADGVTNGLINAMMLFTDGEFTSNWYANVARGGAFPGKISKTMNEQNTGSDKADNYEVTAKTLAKNLAKLGKDLEKFPEVHKQMRNLRELMALFMPGVRILADGGIEIDRGVTKNPLTITLYGSGTRGIAGDIVDELVRSIYERMSTALQAVANGEAEKDASAFFPGDPKADAKYAKLERLINSLITTQPEKKSRSWGIINSSGRSLGTFNPRDLTFTKDQINSLTNNMLSFFVEPMHAAIAETAGTPLMDSMKRVQQAVQVQSIFFQHGFENEVKKLLKEKETVPGWKKSDFLSEAELQGVYSRLKNLFPLVNLGEQEFLITGSNMVDARNLDSESKSAMSTSMTDRYRQYAQVKGPGDAGVKGAPVLTIAAGDAKMMQVLSVMKNAVENSLKIFDGVNLKLSTVQEDNRKANQAVAESWKGNPMRAVADGYAAFTADLDTDALSENSELGKQLNRVFGKFDSVDYDTLKTEMTSLGARLIASAQQIDARREAMLDVPMSIDQMAATGSPFQMEGDAALAGLSEAELLAELNKRYNKALARIKGVETTTSQLSVEFAALGTVSEQGATILDSSAIKKLLSVAKLPADHRVVFKEIVDSLATDGYTVVTGSKQQISDYNVSKGFPAFSTSGNTVNGYMNPDRKIIYIVNPTSDTLIHELVHAATIEAVLDHYTGANKAKGLAGKAASGAVERLELLMNQFLSLGDQVANLNEDGRNDYENAKEAILGHLNDSTQDPATAKASGLNEFMAWGLTTESLIRLQKRNKANPLVVLAQEVFAAIKKLIWGNRKAPEAGKDMFSNLLFNSAVLMSNSPSINERLYGMTLEQSSAFVTDERLTELSETFRRKIGDVLNMPATMTAVSGKHKVRAASNIATDIARSVQAHGFSMGAQEADVFKSIVTALATEASIDPASMIKAEEMYKHVIKTLKPSDFMLGKDPLDPGTDYYNQQQFDVITGKYLVAKDGQNRSTLLPSFLALAMVNEDFRTVLSNMNLPARVMNGWGSIDGALSDIGNTAMDKLSDRLSGTKNAKNVVEAIDGLTETLIEAAQDRELLIETISNKSSFGLDAGNQYLINGMQATSDIAKDKADQLFDKGGTFNRMLASMLRITSGLISEKNGEAFAAGLMAGVNDGKLWLPYREFLADWVGRTESNKDIFDMIKRVNAVQQQDRQQFREVLPETIASKFTKRPTAKQSAVMYAGLAKTDIASLMGTMNFEELSNLITDQSALDTAINTLEKEIQSADPRHWGKYQSKMKQLANFMKTGKPGINLLRNAYAISSLFNETKASNWSQKDEAFEGKIDQLTSLYALNGLSAADRTVLAQLMQNENEGMTFIVAYLTGQRKAEIAKSKTSENAIANIYKGYIPSEQNNDTNLVVAPESDHAKMIARSFVPVGYYDRSSSDPSRVNLVYYFAPVSGRAAFDQGIAQNVRQTAGGVDLITGMSSAMTAGRITENALLRRIAAAQAKSIGNEPLMPVFRADGKIIAYERSIDPAQLQRVQKENNIEKMIGVWAGRQVEEMKSEMFNKALIDALKKVYDKDIASNKTNVSQYVNLYNKVELAKDPVLADALSLLTPETRKHIEAVFGKNEFMVRRDMLLDSFGVRSASVGDMWTGTSRWSPETQERVQAIAIGIFGNSAYRKLVNGERIVQNYVSEARVIIAVKSVVVPMLNLISNLYQLTMRGVPLLTTLRDMPKKANEVEFYTRGRNEKLDAEVELAAAIVKNDVVAERKLRSKIQSIDDSFKRLSIWPLIEVGEFTAISDVSISRADEALLTNGKLSEYAESLIDKLPPALKTAGKYALITKDTALFHGLQKAVSYGDFLAKAVLYDDLTIRQKESKEYALGRVTEEFVNYDRLSGRFRGYLESAGLLWFYNFKIRTSKIALSMIRNNPLHALLATIAPVPDLFSSAGTPITDNLVTKGMTLTLDYSMGPGMGLRAPTLNPWVALMN